LKGSERIREGKMGRQGKPKKEKQGKGQEGRKHPLEINL